MRGPAKTLEIKLLGQFRCSGSHDDLPKKAQALLTYLAMNRGRAIPRDQLAELLWSTSGPEQGRQSLRQSLAAVRRALGADARGMVETVGTDVLLAASGAVDVDVQRFETLAQSTVTADLAAANALYRGEFLADFDVPSEPFMDWVRVERTRLEATACGMLLRLAAALSDAGEHDAAIAVAERLVALDPLREDGHRLLMQLFASVGRRAEAVRQFAICKDNLRRQLDVAPDAKTVALAQAIQAEGPTLALAVGGGTARHVLAAVPADAEISAPAGFSSSSESLPAAPAGGTRPHVPRPSLRPDSRAGWIWALALAGFLVLIAALVVFRTVGSEGRLTGAGVVQSPNAAELGSPAAPASPAVAVSRAIEWGSIAAIVVLPFSPAPPESVPAARLAELVSDDLINNLSRVPGFRVIARSTSIQYAKRPVDVGTLGTDLGVHYAVEGDVRLEDGTVRINIALIDVKTRLQVWAERYERAEAERLSVQDEIVRSLARQLHVSVMADRGRDDAPAPRPSANATLGKAWAAENLFSFQRGGREAGELFQEVLRADPNNVSALTGLGAFKFSSTNNALQAPEEVPALLDEAEALLRRATSLNPNVSLPYYFLALVLTRRGQPEEALPLLEKVLEMNPSYAPAYAAIGNIQMNSGRRGEAIKNIEYALRLSPKDNYLGVWSQYLGRIYIELGDGAQAERWLTQAVNEMPNAPLNHIVLAAFLAERGDVEQARSHLATATSLAPKVTLDQWIEVLTIASKQDTHRPARLLADLTQLVVVSGSAVASQPADQNATPERQRFDGTWTSMIACSAAKGAAEYTIPLEAVVKDGVFHAERGMEGKPNRLTVDGTIQLDGSAELLAQGLTGDAAFTVARDRPGSLYAYHIRAKFEGSRGTGSRVELRPCIFTAFKR